MVEQVVKEKTAAMYGLTTEQMDGIFKTTSEMLRTTDNKVVLIERLMEHFAISKEAVMVCMSCGAMMS